MSFLTGNIGQGHHGDGSISTSSTQTRWLSIYFFFKEKKNALRDFAAFHFTSTNKRTKKPFWREKWGVSKKKEPLKNLGEIKRVGKGSGGQEGTQAELENQSDSTTDNERII